MVNTIINKLIWVIYMGEIKGNEEYNKGYKAAMEDMKKLAMKQMPPEIKKQIEEGNPNIWWPW